METSTDVAFLTQSQLDQMAAHYGKVKGEVTLEQEQWLLFSLGNEIFALSMKELDEIATVTGGVAIPSIKRHVIGLISIRGEPMVLVDTGQAIGLPPAESLHDQQRVLVLKDSDGQLAGFLIDSIVKVTGLSEWQSLGDGEQQHYHSRFVEAVSEYEGKGVSKLNFAELISCINE